MNAPLPPPLREAARLAELYRYEILDSPPEKELDDIVHLAAYICNTPISLISLVDSDRQWFKSKVGLTATETSRIIAFCAHAILDDNILIVPDALADERFKNNPLVTGDPHVRFYCGAPLITPDGYRIGVLNVIDHVPRVLSAEQLEAIRVLSRQVMDHLTLDRQHRELIQSVKEQQRAEGALKRNEAKFRALSETTSSGIYIYSENRILYANPAVTTITGYRLDELLAMSLGDLVHPAFQEQWQARAQAVQQGDSAPACFEFQIVRKDGEARWLDFTAASIEFDGHPARIGTAYDSTERKQVQDAVQAREQHLRDVLNSLFAFVGILAPDGTVIEVNRAPLEMAGLSASDVLGKRVWDCFWVNYDSAVQADMRAACERAARGESSRYDVAIRIAGDRLMTIDFMIAPLRSTTGEVAYLIPSGVDITERYQAEAALCRNAEQLQQAVADAEDRERTLRAVLDSEPECVKTLDAQGAVLTMNRAGLEIFEADSLSQLTDHSIYPLIAEKYREPFRRLTEAVFQGESGRLEFRVVGLKGTRRWLEIHASPLRDQAGAVQALLGITHDITERRKVEEALRESEKRFRLVALASNDVLWDWNLATHEFWWSPNAAKKFGHDPSAEPGIEAWTGRLHSDDRDRILHSLEDTMKGLEESWVGEYRFRLADGSYGFFMHRGQIVRDATGKPLRMIGAIVDVTGTKQAYVSLNDAYARLQTMSREVQAAEEKERRRLSRELHDEFGQLLSAIKFNLNDIGEGLLKIRSPRAIALRRKIRSATGTVDRLFVSFREVLAALRPATLEVLGLVQSIQTVVDELQGRTGIRCSVVINRDDIGVLCGPDVESAIYRMAQELLKNIVSHSKATVATLTLEYADGWVKLTVRDDGVGFAAHQRPQEGRFGIHGIQERAEILGGSVTIRSEPGMGTDVTVRLPCPPTAASRGTVAATRRPKPPTDRKRRKHGEKR